MLGHPEETKENFQRDLVARVHFRQAGHLRKCTPNSHLIVGPGWEGMS